MTDAVILFWERCDRFCCFKMHHLHYTAIHSLGRGPNAPLWVLVARLINKIKQGSVRFSCHLFFTLEQKGILAWWDRQSIKTCPPQSKKNKSANPPIAGWRLIVIIHAFGGVFTRCTEYFCLYGQFLSDIRQNCDCFINNAIMWILDTYVCIYL